MVPNPAAARAESGTEDAFVLGTMLHAYTSEKVKGRSLADAWRRSAPCPYKRFMTQMYGEEVLQAVHNAEAAKAGARAKPEKKGICDTENVPVCYLGGQWLWRCALEGSTREKSRAGQYLSKNGCRTVNVVLNNNV